MKEMCNYLLVNRGSNIDQPLVRGRELPLARLPEYVVVFELFVS